MLGYFMMLVDLSVRCVDALPLQDICRIHMTTRRLRVLIELWAKAYT